MLTTLEVDGLCAVKSVDGNWYRATIVSVQETEVKVQYPDYGNTESFPKESIKKLDSKFYEPCAQALVASLGLVALQDNTLSTFIEWTTEKEIQATLSFGNDGWLASLHLDGVDLAVKLVNEKLAAPQVITNEEEEKVEPAVEEPISLPEGCTQVYISHIDTPGHFWLQMLDKVEKIDEIQAELQTNAETYADIENRELGTLCAAKYLADDQWYRAEILDSDSDITTIRFIDYGNTDVLDNQPGLIKELPEHLKVIERYAVKSSVNAVPTGTGQWSEPASDYFTQLVGDLSAPVDVVIVLKDVTTYVDIFVNGQNLTDKLVSEGHATRSEETECGDLPSCFASHVNSPSEFWIQLESAAPELQTMESAMVDAENFPQLETKEEGVICAAKYPEDGAWYRAQVIVDGSEGTEVLFMDYGNASIANELRNLPDELKVKPALSRKCALQKPRDIKSWSRKSEIKFNELAAEGATIFNVQFIASGDISIVELYLEGKSVTEELVGLCEEVPISERPTPVGEDLHNNGKICYVNSVEEFYVQLEDSVDELDKVIEKLGDAAEFEPISELKVGSICAALWFEDEQWYRAKILEFCDVGYHVQFIDYGNKAKCEEFRQLPEELSLIHPLAKCCCLAGFPQDSTLQESGRNKLDDYAAEVTTFRIEFLDTTREPVLVKMFAEDKDVVSLIVADNNDNNTNSKIGNSTEHDISKETTLESADPEGNPIEEKETKSSEVLENTAEKDKDVKDKLEENTKTDINATNQVVEETILDSEYPPEENLDEELNASQQDELNESFESNHTVIENKSFENKADNLSENMSINDEVKDDIPKSSEQDLATADNLQDSKEVVESTESNVSQLSNGDKSKEVVTNVAYTNGSNHDKVCKEPEPQKEIVMDFPVKESVITKSPVEPEDVTNQLIIPETPVNAQDVSKIPVVEQISEMLPKKEEAITKTD